MRTLMVATSAAVIALAVGVSQPADAASLLSISGSSDLAVPANNDLVPTPNAAFQGLVPLGGVIDDADDSGLFWSGSAQLSTTADNVTLSYSYIGSFAAATNAFTADGGSFTTPGLDESVGGDSTAQVSFGGTQALAGLVSYSFQTTGDFINRAAAYLELREGDGGVLWEISDTPTNVVLLLFDDGWAGLDGDFDDLGVVVVATPIPAAVPLFGAALAGLGLLGWRRKFTN